jgi:hypothetical protein
VPNRAIIHTHLWSLRAEIEQQLRRLTKAQRHLEMLAFIEGDQRAEVVGLVSDIDDIIEATTIVREQAITALGEARLLEETITRGGGPNQR